MGKEKKVSSLSNWVPINGHGLEDGLVSEQKTGRQGERRTFVLDPIYDPKNQEYIYKYRGQSKAPLVAAYGSELLKPVKTKGEVKDKKAEKERKNLTSMAVVTEHIPRRLADVPQLTFGESLYVLDRSLEGYETAYDKCGPMYVNDRMIGFTPEGYSKVWVNEDFANNHPSMKRRILESTLQDRGFLEGKSRVPYVGNDQIDMVENVIDVVGDHCEEGRYPEPFRSHIHQQNYSFRDARKYIKEYALSNQIFVPDRVDIWGNRCWGWRNTHTRIDNHHVIPIPQPQPRKITNGYLFNYISPDSPYNPDIFASRVGSHGVHHGHHY